MPCPACTHQSRCGWLSWRCTERCTRTCSCSPDRACGPVVSAADQPASAFMAGTVLSLPLGHRRTLGLFAVAAHAAVRPFAPVRSSACGSRFVTIAPRCISPSTTTTSWVQPVIPARARDAPAAQPAAAHCPDQRSPPGPSWFMSVQRLAEICQRAVAADPDLVPIVVLTGDFLTMESQSDVAAHLQDALAFAGAAGSLLCLLWQPRSRGAAHRRHGLAENGVRLLRDDAVTTHTAWGRGPRSSASLRLSRARRPPGPGQRPLSPSARPAASGALARPGGLP